MNSINYNEYYNQINALVLDLLGPLRTSKTVNRKAFDDFYLILDKLKNEIKGENLILRKLAGLLVYIYVSINAEGYHSKYPDPIFMELAKVEAYLDDIVWDSPFKK